MLSGSGVVVVKVGGAALADEALAGGLAAHLEALAAGLRGRLVVVHGGGPFVDEMLERLGCETSRVGGLRVTPDEQMPVIAGVLAGTVNKRLVATLTARGVAAVGLSLADGPVVRTRRVDAGSGLGAVGVLAERGRGEDAAGRAGGPVTALLAAGFVPVVSSIAADADGALLNVNADDAAGWLAEAVGATMLVQLSDVEGVRDAGGRTIAELDGGVAEQLISSGVITGGMIPKVRAAARFAELIGRPVVIAGWRDAARVLAGAAGTVVRPVGSAGRGSGGGCPAGVPAGREEVA